jgi:hypothetical protein
MDRLVSDLARRGIRSWIVRCRACGHLSLLPLDRFMPGRAIAQIHGRLRCSRCRAAAPDLLPNTLNLTETELTRRRAEIDEWMRLDAD